MDNVKFNILKYYYDNGIVNLNKLDAHFYYDLSKTQFSDSVNYLIGKKYLKESTHNRPSHELTDFGKKTVSDILQQNRIETKKQILRESLEVDNLRLQNESIKYQNSLRNKQTIIDRLTIDNLQLQNKQLKRYILYSIIGFIFGAFLSNYTQIWTMIKSILTL